MDNSELRIHISFSPEALALVMEGLSLLPLGRSRQLFDALDYEARRQGEAWRTQQGNSTKNNTEETTNSLPSPT